jgi:hypothetical protein
MMNIKKITSLFCLLGVCSPLVGMQTHTKKFRGSTETLLVTIEYGEGGSIKRIVDADHATPETVMPLIKNLAFSDEEERSAFARVLFDTVYQVGIRGG